MDNTLLTEREERLFNAANSAEETKETENKKETIDDLKKRYAGEKTYAVINTVQVDDDNELEFEFLFKKPKPASYDRYVKTLSNSASKASKTFALDNIIPEQRNDLKDTLDEYPAMAISLSNKLLNMLGLADATSVKKL